MFFFASLKIQTFSFTYPDTLFGTVSGIAVSHIVWVIWVTQGVFVTLLHVHPQEA